jgi:hypothetical protein
VFVQITLFNDDHTQIKFLFILNDGQVNIEPGEAEERERGTERNGLTKRETEHWRVLEMAWVLKLTIGIEHLSISITRISGLNTTSIKWAKNRFLGGHKICSTVP